MVGFNVDRIATPFEPSLSLRAQYEDVGASSQSKWAAFFLALEHVGITQVLAEFEYPAVGAFLARPAFGSCPIGVVKIAKQLSPGHMVKSVDSKKNASLGRCYHG